MQALVMPYHLVDGRGWVWSENTYPQRMGGGSKRVSESLALDNKVHGWGWVEKGLEELECTVVKKRVSVSFLPFFPQCLWWLVFQNGFLLCPGYECEQRPPLSMYICMCVLSPFSRVRLHVMPGSSVHGILQARILEWVAMPSSRGSSWPRDRTCISFDSSIADGFLNSWATRETPCMCTHTHFGVLRPCPGLVIH